jgi:manganese/zinc/iron transport system substrate-binding protein
MPSPRFHLATSIFLALLVGVAGGCQPGSGTSGAFTFAGEPPLKIVCTTQQVADAVEHIAGEHAQVEALMGPGVDPHLHRPTPSDLLKLEAADIVFYNGLHLEGRVADALEQLGTRQPVVPLAGLLEEQHDPRLLSPSDAAGVHDPHLWHDVQLWSHCVAYAAERLCEFDPQRADEYRANAAAYRAELEQLDDEVRAAIESIPAERRLLVTAHDAFGYFSKAYGIETIGLKGISTEDEADFAHLDHVRAVLVERKVPAVFVESSTSPRLVNKLIEECAASGHQVRVGHELYSDAMGPAGSGAETYTGMIRANVAAIAEGLKENQP